VAGAVTVGRGWAGAGMGMGAGVGAGRTGAGLAGIVTGGAVTGTGRGAGVATGGGTVTGRGGLAAGATVAAAGVAGGADRAAGGVLFRLRVRSLPGLCEGGRACTEGDGITAVWAAADTNRAARTDWSIMAASFAPQPANGKALSA